MITAKEGESEYVSTFVEDLKGLVKKREITPSRQVIVTAGPYRFYDVQVDFSAAEVIKIDFYSVIRRDAREAQALDYAARCLKADKALED